MRDALRYTLWVLRVMGVTGLCRRSGYGTFRFRSQLFIISNSSPLLIYNSVNYAYIKRVLIRREKPCDVKGQFDEKTTTAHIISYHIIIISYINSWADERCAGGAHRPIFCQILAARDYNMILQYHYNNISQHLIPFRVH